MKPYNKPKLKILIKYEGSKSLKFGYIQNLLELVEDADPRALGPDTDPLA
jgi:hypothetical protein